MRILITTLAVVVSSSLSAQNDLTNPILSESGSSNKWILNTPSSTTSGNLYIAPVNQQGALEGSKQITFFSNGSLGLGSVATPTDDKLLIAGNINAIQGNDTNPKIGFYLHNDVFNNSNNPSIANYGMTKTANSTLSLSGWGGIDFFTQANAQMRILYDGRILIGRNNLPTNSDFANYKLYVQGGILATEVRVSSISNWPDYVFAKGYQLISLDEVEKYINDNGHLSNTPSASEVKQKGLDLSEMIRIQQEKIEELTLYIIEQNKRIKALESKLN
ncbi:MAG: hypothetical protein E2600_03520 [Chryseobacterium sp.]|nr:hypothetical protein [Chryseobacterium sp.]